MTAPGPIAAGELIVDSFAGGGGASLGIEQALGRPVDIAINHDPEAVALHAANHPRTRHLAADVWKVDPREACGGRSVGLAWFSPDCKHFSKAKGGKPVDRRIRDLAWVVIRHAKAVRPRVIMLENVEEFRDWGPLVTVEDGAQRPCPLRKGFTFRRWVRALEALGYRVEHRELRACDYGAPTLRKRLFVIARRDGRPIAWPAPTHARPGTLTTLPPWRGAAECLDWSLPCPSIFGRKRPLAAATLARIARGIRRYVLDAPRPFIVPITHQGDSRVHAIDEPLRTVTTAARGELALVAPSLVQSGYGEREGQAPRALDLSMPLGTAVGRAKHALVAAFLAQHNGGMVGHPAAAPLSTVVQRGSTQGLVAAHLTKFKGTSRDGQAADAPLATVQAGGDRGGGHAGLVYAFLAKYFGTAVGQPAGAPLHTATARAAITRATVNGED